MATKHGLALFNSCGKAAIFNPLACPGVVFIKNFEIFARGNAAGWLETWIAYSFPAQKLSLHFIGEKLFGIILLCM